MRKLTLILTVALLLISSSFCFADDYSRLWTRVSDISGASTGATTSLDITTSGGIIHDLVLSASTATAYADIYQATEATLAAVLARGIEPTFQMRVAVDEDMAVHKAFFICTSTKLFIKVVDGSLLITRPGLQ